LEPPLANRYCHVDFTQSVEEWLDGMTTGWAARSAMVRDLPWWRRRLARLNLASLFRRP
jgi:hypothetical protein